MSPPERLALIAQLWDSLQSDHLPLTDAQRAELELRMASLDHDRDKAVTWAALKAELECVALKVYFFTQAARGELTDAEDWYESEAGSG